VSASSNPCRIAVVIPCFNDGATIRETLASIVEPEPVEIVVVDDGSDEPHTVDVLAQLEAESVRVIRRENGGLSAARMTGVAATSAPYVVAVDADDLEVPGSLTKLADLLDADPEAAVAWGDEQNFDGDTTYQRLGPSLDPWLITYVNNLPTSSLVRREALLAVGGWQLRRGYEDWSLWMSLAERGYRGIHLPVCTTYYRVRSTRMLAGAVSRHQELVAELREHHPFLFAGRHLNRRHSPAPRRCKLLLPLIDRLPLREFTKHRLFRLVNRPLAPLTRLRLRVPPNPPLHGAILTPRAGPPKV
jgi:hypothetical protein